MKNLFISLAIILFSCKENSQTKSIINPRQDNNKPTVSVNMENKLPFTSENIKNYYKLSSDSSSYIININDKKPINFILENTISQIKENEFDIKITPENQYILLESFNFHDNISSQLIMYNTFGENDSKILITQLNNYKNHS